MEKLEQLKKKIFEKKSRYYKEDAFFSIFSGTGGRDAEDWVSILLRMYLKYFEKKGFKVKEINRQQGEEGIKSVTLEVKKGNFSQEFGPYGLLRGENGIHRLVRISPFSKKKLRHTSFASVEVLPIIKTPVIDIKEKDLKIETFRASGPGGQYVNRRESAVRITYLPLGIIVVSSEERLQGENKRKALMILQAKLFSLMEKEKEERLKKEKGERKIPSWGNQLRSYIFHPYQMVKDHRFDIKTSNLEKILNGDLDLFIEKTPEK